MRERFNSFCHGLVGFVAVVVLGVSEGYWPVTIVLSFMFWRYEVNEERNLTRRDPAFEELKEFLVGAITGVIVMMASGWW